MANHPAARSERIQLLVLERVDAKQNTARYYVLSVEPTLFGDTALVREWGRIGASRRPWLDLYSGESDAREALGEWFARKLRREHRSPGSKLLG